MEGPRAEGTHISELVHCLRQAKARRQGLLPAQTPSETLLFAVGRAVQDYLTGQKAIDGEVPLVKDDIHGTVDNMEEDWGIRHGTDDARIPGEYKATYASAAKNPLETAHYFDQLAAYCAMMGVTRGVLTIMYLNGYYDFMRKRPRPGATGSEKVVLKTFDVEYTREELANWWAVLVERAGILNESQTYTDIPVQHHADWECGYCPLYQKGCDGGAAYYENRWKL